MDACPEGLIRYQARSYVCVDGDTMAVWNVRCLPPTAEVGQLVQAGFLVAEVDGRFPDPVVARSRCCGR